MKTHLSKRLIKLASLVVGTRVADIGCDHGKLVAYLFEKGKIDYAFISDISKDSLQKAIDLLNGCGYHNFEYAVGDGLVPLKETQVDTIVIAGMGGQEIIKILQNNNTKTNTFVLSPQKNEYELRKYLNKYGYVINSDSILLDDKKYYCAMQVSLGKQKLKSIYYYFGQNNFYGNKDFEDYLEQEYNKYVKLLCVVPYFKSFKIRKYIKIIKKAQKLLGENNERNIRISKSR